MPLWVTEKQTAEVCRHQHGPAEQQSPGPRATAGLRHPEQHWHHPACPQGIQACQYMDLLQSSYGSYITCAPSPEPPSPARARLLQDGVLLPFRGRRAAGVACSFH